MIKYVLTINRDALTYLERCYYEYEISKDNVVFMGTNGDAQAFNTPAYKVYEDRQLEAKITLENVKQEITERFIPEVFKHHQVNWEADFRMKRLVITQICDCEIDVSNLKQVEEL